MSACPTCGYERRPKHRGPPSSHHAASLPQDVIKALIEQLERKSVTTTVILRQLPIAVSQTVFSRAKNGFRVSKPVYDAIVAFVKGVA